MGKKRTVTRFLKDVGAMLHARAESEPALLPFATALDDVQVGALGKSSRGESDLPALAHLPTALSALAVGDEAFQSMLRSSAEAMTWYSPYDPADAGEGPGLGMAAGQMAGPHGLWRRDDVIAGLFLLRPDVNYPLHDHEADELYFVLSGSVNIQNGFSAAPRRIEPGDYSVTPSGVAHSLTTAEAPALILYIWRGKIDCEIFWWEHLTGETWRRFKLKLVRKT